MQSVITTGDRLRCAEWTTWLQVSLGVSPSAARNIFVDQKWDFYCSDRWSCLGYFTPPYTPWPWLSFTLEPGLAEPLIYCHPAVTSSLSTYGMTHGHGNWSRVLLGQPSLCAINQAIHTIHKLQCLLLSAPRSLCLVITCHRGNKLTFCPFPDTQIPRLYLGQEHWFLQMGGGGGGTTHLK